MAKLCFDGTLKCDAFFKKPDTGAHTLHVNSIFGDLNFFGGGTPQDEAMHAAPF